MTEQLKIENLIKFPIKEFNGYPQLFDSENNHILDVRGWARLSNQIEDGETFYNEQRGVELQDFICEWIIDALNSYSRIIDLTAENERLKGIELKYLAIKPKLADCEKALGGGR